MRSIYPNKLQRYPHFPFRVEKGLYILPISCIQQLDWAIMSVFRRTAYNKLLDWKASNGSRAIMLEGARRVGKSTLAQEFAQSKYKSHLVIDESVASEKRRPETQLVSGLISKKRLVVLLVLSGFYQPAEVVDTHEPFPLRGRVGFEQR